MLYVTSDLHGFPPEALQQLLAKADFSERDELIVLGDVIDRNGDGGIATLRWMMRQRNVRMILGNHERMMLRCAFVLDPVTEHALADETRLALLSTWLDNGAEPTLRSLRALRMENPQEAADVFSFVSRAPRYALVRAGSRSFLLTHAGLGHFAPGKPLDAYTEEDLLWNRPSLTDSYFGDVFTVFGHTPVAYYGAQYRGKMLLTRTWADIDTGAAMGAYPMLLRLQDMQPFYVDA